MNLADARQLSVVSCQLEFTPEGQNVFRFSLFAFCIGTHTYEPTFANHRQTWATRGLLVYEISDERL